MPLLGALPRGGVRRFPSRRRRLELAVLRLALAVGRKTCLQTVRGILARDRSLPGELLLKRFVPAESRRRPHLGEASPAGPD